ncbi:MAG: hypothetical protein M3Y41_17330 [Pseudomonadota bacterium]|nr:hypothetical protein [Pseudomonadota bacterium]
MLDAWKAETPDFPNYTSGVDGPGGSNDLLRRDGRAWRPVGDWRPRRDR